MINEDIIYMEAPIQEIPFTGFPKIARLSRECWITEKIDGTNAQVFILPNGRVLAGSRTRWITPSDDNYGFAAWVCQHREELLALGPGHHFGEWWGVGIQRGYGLSERRWSLFNTARWCPAGAIPKRIPDNDPRVVKTQQVLPDCCSLVPVLYQGIFTTQACGEALERLRQNGSLAAPGFKRPEGVVCYLTAANMALKKTLEKDDKSKSE